MDKRKQAVLDSIKKAWPNLTDLEKERLTGFGEGLSYKTEWLREHQANTEKHTQAV